MVEDLTGRYIKALVNYPFGGSVKKGEIGYIRDNNHWIDFPSHVGYTIYPHQMDEVDKVELMPVGWSPDKDEIINTYNIF